MATIADTLNEIQALQEEFKKLDENEYLMKELMSFTTIIFFEYLSHAVLDNLRDVDLSKIHGSKKYYELFNQKDLLNHYIRFNNISQLLVVWNTYEKFLRNKANDLGINKFKISELFDELLNNINPSNKSQIKEEFEVIRNTRNSFHDGGVYNPTFNSFTGVLRGKTYTFTPGSEVTPLRIMDVIQTIWSHYQEFKN